MMLLSDDDRSELRTTRQLVTDHGLADLTEQLFLHALANQPAGPHGALPSPLQQPGGLMHSVGLMLDALSAPPDPDFPDLFQLALDLGRHHRADRTDGQHYAEAFLTALDGALGMAFTQEARAAWERLAALLLTALDLGAQLHDQPDVRPLGVPA